MLSPFRLVLAPLRHLLKRVPGVTTEESAPTRAPTSVPRRRTAGAPKAGKQTLWCEPGGHNWTRAAKPGRKPKACSRHA